LLLRALHCAAAAAERLVTIDRYILPIGRSAANPQQPAAAEE